MADNNKKQIVEDIEKDISKLEASLNNLAGVINDKILNKLSDTKDKTRDWLNEFEKGKDISKQVSAKLGELQRESNKLALNRIKLETDLARVQKLGLTAAEKKIKEALLSNKLADQEINKAQTVLYNLQQKTGEQKKQNNLQKTLDNLKKQFRVDEIKDMFTLAGIFKLIIDGALRFNTISVDIGKNLGYGADQADRVTKNLAHSANMSNNLNFTLKNAAEATTQLNEATGGVAEYSADALETQIMLTKQFKLTGEEAAGLYKFSTLTGKESSQINKEMIAAFSSTRNMVKGSANMKKTFADVAKVSGQLAVNFKNNPAEITKAVVKAQALGTTLEKVKDQGKQLLNFESSIENELEAELITGKQLNLERARAAALMGDQEALMEELNAQGMSLEEFGNMNVVAQESFAKALGLSADELAEQLRKQKIAQEQGKSLAEIAAQEAEEAQKRQDIQDKFNAAIIKLQDGISNLVAGPLGQFLEMLGKALGFITYIVQGIQMVFDWTTSLGTAIGKWMDKLGVVGKILKGIASVAIVLAAYMAYGALAAIPIIGPALGLVASGAIIAGGFAMLNSQKANDMVSEGGYGKRTLLAPEGAIKLNDKDTVIAGTNLGGGGNKGGGGGGESMTMVVAAIKDLQNSINRLASRPVTINMDGAQVGTIVGRRNETGTEQVKNSYSLA